MKELDLVKDLIDMIVQLPIVPSTKKEYIMYRKKIENGTFTEVDYYNFGKLMELNNMEMEARDALMEIGQTKKRVLSSESLSEVPSPKKRKKSSG